MVIKILDKTTIEIKINNKKNKDFFINQKYKNIFQKNNKNGSPPKKGKSKFSKEIKERLGDMTNNIIKDINIKELTNYERIQFLRTILPYLIPKTKEVSHENIFEEQTMIQVEIIESNKDVVKEK